MNIRSLEQLRVRLPIIKRNIKQIKELAEQVREEDRQTSIRDRGGRAGFSRETGPTLLLQVAKARQIRVDGILADVMLQVILSKDLVTIVTWPV
jgi:hypothetical protein